MGGNESIEAGTKVWNEVKKSTGDFKALIPQFLPFSKNWNTFTSIMSSTELRDFFNSDKENYFALTSQVTLTITSGYQLLE